MVGARGIVKFPLIIVEAPCLSQILFFFANRMNVLLNHTADKKRAIFESTLRLIEEFGFHGSPMSQIAQEADVAIGTIYHYFTSKDELIIQLFRYCMGNIQQATFKTGELAFPYSERFAQIWINLVKYYIEYPEVLSFVEQFFSSPYVKAKEGICFHDELSVFLKEGIEEGYIKRLDINIISAAFIGTIAATAKRHINGRFTFKEDDMRNMVGIIWDGIKIN